MCFPSPSMVFARLLHPGETVTLRVPSLSLSSSDPAGEVSSRLRYGPGL